MKNAIFGRLACFFALGLALFALNANAETFVYDSGLTVTGSYNNGSLGDTSWTYSGTSAMVSAQTDMLMNTGYKSGLTGTMNEVSPGVWVVSYTSSVPEPETYAMMAIGLSMMGWMARRRRNVPQVNQKGLVAA